MPRIFRSGQINPQDQARAAFAARIYQSLLNPIEPKPDVNQDPTPASAARLMRSGRINRQSLLQTLRYVALASNA